MPACIPQASVTCLTGKRRDLRIQCKPAFFLTVMPHESALHTLRASLDALRQKQLSIDAFCSTWRAETGLLSALPARYGQVMEDLLGRMEAGSLFTEESCSFSHEDLQASLATWLDKARQTLEKASCKT
jgi:hypothetical protein